MTRIITLGPVNSTPTNVTFEEAFGEFSEARGRGGERRAARQAARAERRASNSEARHETGRRGRKARRQEARQERKLNRQEMRSNRQTRREDRKEHRQDSRQERKLLKTQSKIGENLEQGLDQGVDQEMGQTQDQGYAPQEQGGGYDSGYADQGSSDQGGGYDSGYADQGSSDQGGGYDASYTSAESAYDYGNDETGGSSDSGNDYGNDYESDYSESNDIPEGGDFNFDGIMGAEDRFNELSDGSVSVTPEIQSIADKLEWNKELVSRLEEKRENSNINPQDISKVILIRTERIDDLGAKLDDYYNACGEYSCFDSSDEKGRANRAMEITHAKRKARKKLTKVQSNLNPEFGTNRIVVPAKEGNSNASGMETKEIKNRIAWHRDRIASLRQERNALPTGPGNAAAHQRVQNQINNSKAKIAELQAQLGSGFDGDDFSMADGGLNANQLKNKIAWHRDKLASLRQERNALPTGPGHAASRQKIQNQIDNHKAKIAAFQAQLGGSSNADGTGLNGLDLVDDFDAPNVREIQLGADGSMTSNIKWGSVFLGVGIGIAAVWAIKKYNILK